MTENQIIILERLAKRAEYNATHIRNGATQEEIKGLIEKVDALMAALSMAKGKNIENK